MITFDLRDSQRLIITNNGEAIGLHPNNYDIVLNDGNLMIMATGSIKYHSRVLPITGWFQYDGVDWANCTPPQSAPSTNLEALELINDNFLPPPTTEGGLL